MKRKPKSKTSEIILKTKKGPVLERPAKCDECPTVVPHVTQFPKSNRNFTVNLCDRCLPGVIERSFPRAKGKAAQQEERFQKEYYDRQGVETSRDDAMNHAVGGGQFESDPRTH